MTPADQPATEKLIIQAARHLGGTYTVDEIRRFMNSEGWKVNGECVDIQALQEVVRDMYKRKIMWTAESKIHWSTRWAMKKGAEL